MLGQEAIRGRGAQWNPANRFPGGVSHVVDDTIEYDPNSEDEPKRRPETIILEDSAKTILTHNDSPDVGAAYNLNPYRGCEHGCIYCYARPGHEYMGYSAGLDFETKIFVKRDAPMLLRRELSAKSWRPEPISLSGITDVYQPIERELHITRQCLEVLLDFRQPVGIITKNRLVTRDIDLLAEMASFGCAAVFVTVTTLDLKLNRILEPRTSAPAQRLDAIRQLSAAGIPVGVMVAPVIPGLTDHETPAILEAVAEAGAKRANYIMLRLPYAVAPLFESWLDEHYPDRKEKVLNRLRSLRGGKLYKADYATRMKGEGEFAEQQANLFRIACKKYGLNQEHTPLSVEHFRRPGQDQMLLF